MSEDVKYLTSEENTAALVRKEVRHRDPSLSRAVRRGAIKRGRALAEEAR